MISSDFIIDLGPSIGNGHYSRCTLLSDALSKNGHVCHLYVPDIAFIPFENKNVCTMPNNLTAFPGGKLLICDSYSISDDVLSHLSDLYEFICVFDDIGEASIEADIIINHNIYAKEIMYKEVASEMIMSGPEYFLLDKLLIYERDKSKLTTADKVIIYFGGNENILKCLLNEIVSKTNIRVDVVIPPSVEPSSGLMGIVNKSKTRIVLHHGANISKLLANASIYIGSSGVMAVEAAVAGLKLILHVAAENQTLNADALRCFGHDVVVPWDYKKATELLIKELKYKSDIEPLPVDADGPKRLARALTDIVA